MLGSDRQSKVRAEHRTVRVFVSSTWLDLGSERKAIEQVLQRFRETKFVGMEYFGSADEDTRTASLDSVDRCQLYIGIIGSRYGSGITEMEYQRARARHLPCMIYFRQEAIPSSSDTSFGELESFRTKLRQSHTVTEFHNADDLAALLAADLHNWLSESLLTTEFIEESVEGIVALPADYASRIQNFLVDYLGSERVSVPFGGRSADLARLDAWLDAPQQPYTLLAAPAGRGKSALVSRWTSSLLARPEIITIFMPVSIRFRTNLATVVFTSLAARLAKVFGEDLPSVQETTIDVWRVLVTNYLRRPPPEGRRVVVVLDGLDEAADWEAGADLFPADPPDGLKILVTARYRAGDLDSRSWLERLGWSRSLATAFDLPPLTCDGVTDVLARMGSPLDRVSSKIDIIRELFRLSGGDPLLVRLYADDLWSRKDQATSLRPDDLHDIPPGLEGYFQRWWREQRVLWGKETPLREKTVQAVLNLLACALGPLTTEDLIQVAPEECGLDTWTLEDALQPLSRFVIGDGRTHGFVFSHPRLTSHFYEQLSGVERRTWAARFLHWGRRTLAALNLGQINPQEASPYLIQYFGAHLERSGAGCDQLFSLVSNGWRLAWLSSEGAYGGFLNDVRRAWRALDTADSERSQRGQLPEHLGHIVHCALCLASVRSLAANIRPRLVKALVESSLWTGAQALAFLRQTPSTEHRAAGLALIAPRLPEALLEEAVELSEGQVPPKLVQRLLECGRGPRAVELMRQGSDDSKWLLEILSGAEPVLGQIEAEAVLQIISGLPVREHATAVLGISKAFKAEHRDELLRIELGNAIAEACHEGIASISAALPAEAVRDVVQTVRYSAGQSDNTLTLSILLDYLPESARKRTLEALLSSIDNSALAAGWLVSKRQLMLANLVPHVDAATRERLLTNLSRQRISADLAAKLKPYLKGEHVRALLRAGTGDADDRIDLWAALSAAIPEQMWDELLETLLSGEIHAGALRQVITSLPENGVRRAYERAIEMVDDDTARVLVPRLDLERVRRIGAEMWVGPELSAAIASRLAKMGEWQQSIELIDKLHDRTRSYYSDMTSWDPLFVELCHSLVGNREGIAAALTLARKAWNVPAVIDAIAADLPSDLLPEALSAVQLIGDSQMRDRCLLNLGHSLISAGNTMRGMRLAYESGCRLGEWERWLRRFSAEEILHILREAHNREIEQRVLEVVLGSDGTQLIIGADGMIQWDVAELLISGPPDIAELQRFITEIWTPEQGTTAIRILAERLDRSQRESIARLVISMADPFFRGELLKFLISEWRWATPDWPACLITRIVQELVEFVAARAKASPEAWDYLEGACHIANSDDLGMILAALSCIGERSRGQALSLMADKINAEDWRTAWSIAQGINDTACRARAFSSLLRRAPRSDATLAIAEALEAALAELRNTDDSEAFLIVCQNIQDPVWTKAWTGMRTIRSDNDRLRAMTALLERAPLSAGVTVIRDAMEIAQQTQLTGTETWIAIARAAPEPAAKDAWRAGWRCVQSRSAQGNYHDATEFIANVPEWMIREISAEVSDNFFSSQDYFGVYDAIYRRGDPIEFISKVAAKAASLDLGPESWINRFPREATLAWLATHDDSWTLAAGLACQDWSIDDGGSETPEIRARAAELAARISDSEAKSYLERNRVPQRYAGGESSRFSGAGSDGTGEPTPVTRRALLSNLLDGAAQQTRDQWLDRMIPMIKEIGEVGGSKALEQTADAIERVCEWWP